MCIAKWMIYLSPHLSRFCFHVIFKGWFIVDQLIDNKPVQVRTFYINHAITFLEHAIQL